LEELADSLGGNVGDGQPIYRFAAVLGYEGQQLHEHVPITLLGVHREIAFADQMLEKEAANPRTHQRRLSHGCCPLRNVETADSLRAEAAASGSDSAG